MFFVLQHGNLLRISEMYLYYIGVVSWCVYRSCSDLGCVNFDVVTWGMCKQSHDLKDHKEKERERKRVREGRRKRERERERLFSRKMWVFIFVIITFDHYFVILFHVKTKLLIMFVLRSSILHTFKWTLTINIFYLWFRSTGL